MGRTKTDVQTGIRTLLGFEKKSVQQQGIKNLKHKASKRALFTHGQKMSGRQAAISNSRFREGGNIDLIFCNGPLLFSEKDCFSLLENVRALEDLVAKMLKTIFCYSKEKHFICFCSFGRIIKTSTL